MGGLLSRSCYVADTESKTYRIKYSKTPLMNRARPYIFVYTAKGGFMRELRVGFESALDFWRAARIAAPGRVVEVPEGKIYGARELSLSEQVSLACNLCNTEPPLDVVVPDAAHRHAHVWPITYGKGQSGPSACLALGAELKCAGFLLSSFSWPVASTRSSLSSWVWRCRELTASRLVRRVGSLKIVVRLSAPPN